MILVFVYNSYSQEEKEVIYLLFDEKSKEKCKIYVEQNYENNKGISFVKRYRSKKEKDNIIFYICEEIFYLDKRHQIDTCNFKYLQKIKFETLKAMNQKRKNSKYAFKNSVFKKIYLVENKNDKVIKYPVIWNTDMIQK